MTPERERELILRACEFWRMKVAHMVSPDRMESFYKECKRRNDRLDKAREKRRARTEARKIEGAQKAPAQRSDRPAP